MKTYEEICNEIAKEWGCNSWKEMDWYHVNYSGEYPINGQYAQEALTQQAAERYANYKAEIAWEEGRQSSFWADQYPNTAKTTNPYKQK